MALITAAQARLFIPNLTGTGEDTNLDTMIAAAGAAIAAWCGYPPASAGAAESMESVASYTRYLTGSGGRDLVLDVWPVTAITSIYDDSSLTYGSDTLVASTDYAIIDGSRGLVRLTATSTWGAWSSEVRDAIRVIFTAGFTTTPAPLKQACAMVVKTLWDARRTIGAQSVSQAGVTTSFRDEVLIPPAAKAILQAYRLPRAIL